MDWKEVTIYTTTAGIGPVEAVLDDVGVEGYVLEDAADFEEFLKDTEIYWDYVDEELVREASRLPDSSSPSRMTAQITPMAPMPISTLTASIPVAQVLG